MKIITTFSANPFNYGQLQKATAFMITPKMIFNAHTYGCSYGAKLKFLYSDIFVYSENFLYSRDIFIFRGIFKFRDFFIFRDFCICSRKFCIKDNKGLFHENIRRNRKNLLHKSNHKTIQKQPFADVSTVRTCFTQVFLKISQNSQEIPVLEPVNFAKIFKNTFFHRTLLVAVSDHYVFKVSVIDLMLSWCPFC